MKNQVSNITSLIEKKEHDGFLIGNRVPREFFETSGIGESDIAIHAGSYHLALKNANIEMYNIMTYSSILPGIAEKVNPPAEINHGAVLESIMSVSHAGKGELTTAGIIYGWLYDRVTAEKYGGLVCEHTGNYNKEELNARLGASLEELYLNGFVYRYELRDIETLTKSFIPTKTYGTALVALCFISYYFPVLKRRYA